MENNQDSRILDIQKALDLYEETVAPIYNRKSRSKVNVSHAVYEDGGALYVEVKLEVGAKQPRILWHRLRLDGEEPAYPVDSPLIGVFSVVRLLDSRKK